MIEATLKKLGLPDKAVRVYLTLLPLGPQPVRKIAEASGLNRGTAYDMIKILIEEGLVSYYHQDKHQYFIAENPSRLVSLVEERQRQLTTVGQSIAQLLPSLQNLKERNRQPIVRFFEGAPGISRILEDVLTTMSREKEKLYQVFSSPAIGSHLYRAYPEFIPTRIKKKIAVQVISLGAGGTLYGLDERKWIPTNLSPAPTYTIIYKNKLAMISLDEDEHLIGLIIQHSELVKTQKIIFQTLWQTLP